MGLLVLSGILLLFPGLCFLAAGNLAGPNNPGGVILGVAAVLIGTAIIIRLFLNGD